MTEAAARIHAPDLNFDLNYWWVEGDLRTPGSGWDESNYDLEESVKFSLGQLADFVEFDSESSCFYAYAQYENVAREVLRVANAVAENRAAGAPKPQTAMLLTDPAILDAYLDRIDALIDAMATDPAISEHDLAIAYSDLSNRIGAAGQSLIGIREWNLAMERGGVR